MTLYEKVAVNMGMNAVVVSEDALLNKQFTKIGGGKLVRPSKGA